MKGSTVDTAQREPSLDLGGGLKADPARSNSARHRGKDGDDPEHPWTLGDVSNLGVAARGLDPGSAPVDPTPASVDRAPMDWIKPSSPVKEEEGERS